MLPPAMRQTTFLDTAFELLTHAVNAEDNYRYIEAYTKYMSALDYLMAAQQSETNDKSRALLKMKADEYLSRAEAIRRRADSDTHMPKGSDMGAGCSSQSMQALILDEAFKCAKEAVKADGSRNLTEAYRQYMKSVDYFMFAQRYESDEQSRLLIRSEVGEYLSRAETIKRHLDLQSESRATDNVKLREELPRPPEAIFLHTAIEIAQRAVQQDVKKNYRSAYELYNGALDYFMLAQKYEKNEQSKTAIRANIEEYLARAEVLKKCI